ncbi:MAG: metallophosphoesterase [Dinoroseobacter sp.]|nr:metallophosphoesterase [Dinoroseobacter sp.]
MKLLVTGDIHYALKQYDWLLKSAPDFDGVVITGDLLEVASAVDLNAQIVVVRAYLQKLAAKTRLIVCSGNHDLNAKKPDGERVPDWLGELGARNITVDGDRARFADTLVSVFPWWDGPDAKARIAVQLARDVQEPRTSWIWAYHAPPADTPTSWGGRRYFGDPELTRWIEAYGPDLVFCGHVHQAPFTKEGAWADRVGSSWVFNMGQQPGEIPSHIIVDIARQKAMWTSIAGAEELDLSTETSRPVPLSAAPDWLRA